jgi:hypothetical protein
MDATMEQIIYFAWLFGTSVDRTLQALAVHGHRSSRIEIVATWLIYDEAAKA